MSNCNKVSIQRNLLDYLVGASDQAWRDLDTQRLRGT